MAIEKEIPQITQHGAYTPHNNIETPICDECGSALIIEPVRAEIVCPNCGLVFSQKGINYDASGKNTYSEKERSEKLTRGDFYDYLRIHQYKTVVIWKKDMRTAALKRAFKLNNRIINSAIRRDLTVGALVSRACSILDVPTHIKRSCLYYLKRIFNTMDSKGRTLADLIGNLLFQICKAEQFAIKIEKIAEACGASQKRMLKWQQVIQSLVPEFKNVSTSPVMYIPKLCAELNLGQNMQTQAIKILKKVPSRALSGRSPPIIAATLLYLLNNNGAVTQKESAKAINCSEASIRNISKILKPILNKLNIRGK